MNGKVSYEDLMEELDAGITEAVSHLSEYFDVMIGATITHLMQQNPDKTREEIIQQSADDFIEMVKRKYGRIGADILLMKEKGKRNI